MPTRIENRHKIQNLLVCVPFHFALNLKQFYFNKRKMSTVIVSMKKEALKHNINDNGYQVRFDVSSETI